MQHASLFDLATALDMLGMPDAKGLCQRITLLGGAVGSAWRSLSGGRKPLGGGHVPVCSIAQSAPVTLTVGDFGMAVHFLIP